ncbi:MULTISPECIES: ATP-binding protein [unclassified Streptomyces]|uniref:ATP-binding protein n=1 Tax=unclassified Streptomyces TaxID=2593676 RepID=UPI0004BE8E0D|nr:MULTISPECIES: ATP-binding protein [unclassified Streptomyces]
MDGAARNEDQLLDDGPMRASAAYEGRPGDIARARDLVRDFLTRVQSEHGFPVTERAMGTAQLVVSELMTNACKYAAGPCLVDLGLDADRVEITVWDSAPVLPVAKAADPGRVGQHGLEIVMAVCQSFEVHREPVGKRTIAAIALGEDATG